MSGVCHPFFYVASDIVSGVTLYLKKKLKSALVEFTNSMHCEWQSFYCSHFLMVNYIGQMLCFKWFTMLRVR